MRCMNRTELILVLPLLPLRIVERRQAGVAPAKASCFAHLHVGARRTR